MTGVADIGIAGDAPEAGSGVAGDAGEPLGVAGGAVGVLGAVGEAGAAGVCDKVHVRMRPDGKERPVGWLIDRKSFHAKTTTLSHSFILTLVRVLRTFCTTSV